MKPTCLHKAPRGQRISGTVQLAAGKRAGSVRGTTLNKRAQAVVHNSVGRSSKGLADCQGNGRLGQKPSSDAELPHGRPADLANSALHSTDNCRTWQESSKSATPGEGS